MRSRSHKISGVSSPDLFVSDLKAAGCLVWTDEEMSRLGVSCDPDCRPGKPVVGINVSAKPQISYSFTFFQGRVGQVVEVVRQLEGRWFD